MGLSVGNQIYKGGAINLDNGVGKIGYYRYSSSNELKTFIGTDIKSVHEIVKPGYYRINLGHLRTYLPNTFSGVMQDTKLPNDSKVLIHIPEDYLDNSYDKIMKKRLGLLEYAQLYPSSNVNDSVLDNIYKSIYSTPGYAPYIISDRLKDCVFKSTQKTGKIDNTWTFDDVNNIYDMELVEQGGWTTHQISFYVPGYQPIEVYIEGYGFCVVTTNNIAFAGEPTPADAYKYIPKIYESFVCELIIKQTKTDTTNSSLNTWGYNLPFPKTASTTAPSRVVWADKAPYAIGTGIYDSQAILNMPYNPNIFSVVGEMPAEYTANIPLTFDMNHLGITTSCPISSIGSSGLYTYLPLGYYLFDKSNNSKFSYINLWHDGYDQLFSIETLAPAGAGYVIQKLYEENTSRLCIFRAGGSYSSSTSSPWSWKSWTYIAC